MLRTSVVAGPLPLAQDLEGTAACCWKPVVTFLTMATRVSSAWSRFRFFGAGGTSAAEEVLADMACASAAARALVLMGAE